MYGIALGMLGGAHTARSVCRIFNATASAFFLDPGPHRLIRLGGDSSIGCKNPWKSTWRAQCVETCIDSRPDQRRFGPLDPAAATGQVNTP